MTRISVLLALALGTMVAGCLSTPIPSSRSPADSPACVHPYPCGDEWPTGLEGPFAIKEILDLRLPTHDKIPLETYVFLPKLPEGVKAPVVLWSTPYPGSCPSNALRCYTTGDDPQSSTRIDVKLLVERGYAVAVSNVRGTGNSGGCFELGGRNEQKDQVVLIEWLAAQPWSNGRVGMMGHSYPSYTLWMAAIQNPPALKTIVASGLMTDAYTTVHTPQGAASADGGWFLGAYATTLGFVPPLGGPPAHATVEHAPVAPQRVCPGLADTTAETQRSAVVNDRKDAFWSERRLVSGIPDVTAATFIVSGYEDSSMLFHAFQDDDLWSVLATAPKRILYGHWGHALPPPAESLQVAPFGPDWYDDALVPWLDYWLKGVGGQAPRLGLVDYESSDDAWHTTTSWPPQDLASEVLYVGGASLAPGPTGDAARAKLVPTREAPPCSRYGKLFATEPVGEAVRIAGNPFAYLRVSSDEPGGVIALDLYDLGPGFTCSGPSQMTWLAGGGADLRFHQGSLTGKDFPRGQPTMVRIDINNQAWTFGPGHRLALALTADGNMDRAGQPYFPNVVIHTDAVPSHLVIPVVEGTFGGSRPSLDYPPRPFLPAT